MGELKSKLDVSHSECLNSREAEIPSGFVYLCESAFNALTLNNSRDKGKS